MAAESPGAPDPGENTEPSFEQSLSELERIVRQLEAGEKPLEESLILYERGVAVYRRCNQILEKAKNRIRLVLAGPNGEPILREGDLSREQPQPLSPQSTQTNAPPRRRKSHAPAAQQESPAASEEEQEVEPKTVEIPKQTVDSEPQRQQNPPASLNPRPRSTPPKPTMGGGSLFGSA